MRVFKGGSTRDDDTGKIDYEGYLHPLVLQRYGQYMLKHQTQADGNKRASDNWQRGKGIPTQAYIKSDLRHVIDVWLEHRGYASRDGLEDALCAEMFNTMGHLLSILKKRIKKKNIKRVKEKKNVKD